MDAEIKIIETHTVSLTPDSKDISTDLMQSFTFLHRKSLLLDAVVETFYLKEEKVSEYVKQLETYANASSANTGFHCELNYFLDTFDKFSFYDGFDDMVSPLPPEEAYLLYNRVLKIVEPNLSFLCSDIYYIPSFDYLVEETILVYIKDFSEIKLYNKEEYKDLPKFSKVVENWFLKDENLAKISENIFKNIYMGEWKNEKYIFPGPETVEYLGDGRLSNEFEYLLPAIRRNLVYENEDWFFEKTEKWLSEERKRLEMWPRHERIAFFKTIRGLRYDINKLDISNYVPNFTPRIDFEYKRNLDVFKDKESYKENIFWNCIYLKEERPEDSGKSSLSDIDFNLNPVYYSNFNPKFIVKGKKNPTNEEKKEVFVRERRRVEGLMRKILAEATVAGKNPGKVCPGYYEISSENDRKMESYINSEIIEDIDLGKVLKKDEVKSFLKALIDSRTSFHIRPSTTIEIMFLRLKKEFLVYLFRYTLLDISLGHFLKVTYPTYTQAQYVIANFIYGDAYAEYRKNFKGQLSSQVNLVPYHKYEERLWMLGETEEKREENLRKVLKLSLQLSTLVGIYNSIKEFERQFRGSTRCKFNNLDFIKEVIDPLYWSLFVKLQYVVTIEGQKDFFFDADKIPEDKKLKAKIYYCAYLVKEVEWDVSEYLEDWVVKED